MSTNFKEPTLGSELTPEQQRLGIVKRVNASEALEGYKPLTVKDGVAYVLEQRWIKGEITLEEEGK